VLPRYSPFHYRVFCGMFRIMLFLCLFIHLLSQYRCIFAIIICSISYYNQPTSSSPPALFFHLPSILTTEHNTHSHYTNGDEHHSVGPSLAHGEDVSSDGAPLMSPPSPPPSSLAAPMPEAGLLQLPPTAPCYFALRVHCMVNLEPMLATIP
jgi:hypothetical protein